MTPVLDEQDLKVIRLDNGDILFSKVLIPDRSKNTGYLELHWPMKVLMKIDEEDKSTQIALLKWLFQFPDGFIFPWAAFHIGNTLISYFYFMPSFNNFITTKFSKFKIFLAGLNIIAIFIFLASLRFP